MSLAAVVIPLSGTPQPSPLHARGWFYSLLKDHTPDVHDREGPKPFTVGVGGRNESYLRLTFLDETLYATLSPALYAAAEQPLVLGRRRYTPTHLLQEDHAWAGLVTWPKLFQTPARSDASLHFASPTYFSKGKTNYPVPEPSLIFASLVARWNAYAPLEVPDAIREALLQNLTVRYLNVVTRTQTTHDRIAGFTGRITFHLPNADDDAAHWLAVLTHFAFYSGVGAKTTLGYGQAKPYRHDPSSERES